MIHGYKYRLYPNAEQKAYFAKAFGCCRYAYNYYVREHERIYKQEKRMLWEFDLMRAINDHKQFIPWLADAETLMLEWTAVRVADGWRKWLKDEKKRKNPPREHKKGERSFMSYTGNVLAVSFRKNEIIFPKIGAVKAKVHRRFDGDIKHATVKLLATGEYYVSICVDTRHGPVPMKPFDKENAVGIDLGVRHFVTLSDGTQLNIPDVSREKRRKAFLQRRLKHQKQGSKGYENTKRQIARLTERITNVRRDFHHKTAADLCSRFSAVCMETVNVSGMRQSVGKKKDMRTTGFNRQLAHVGIGQFSRIVEEKCKESGTHFTRIDRWEPSTKTCHHCGYVLPEIKLSVEEWTCPECGMHHDRDVNAAINIKMKGLEQLPLAERNDMPATEVRKIFPGTGKVTVNDDCRPSTQIEEGTALPRLAKNLDYYVSPRNVNRLMSARLRKLRLKERSIYGVREFTAELAKLVKMQNLASEIGVENMRYNTLYKIISDTRFSRLMHIIRDVLPQMIDEQCSEEEKRVQQSQERLEAVKSGTYYHEGSMMYFVSSNAVAAYVGMAPSSIENWAKNNNYALPKYYQVEKMKRAMRAYQKVACQLRTLRVPDWSLDSAKKFSKQSRKLVQLGRVCSAFGLGDQTECRELFAKVNEPTFEKIMHFLNVTLPDKIDTESNAILEQLEAGHYQSRRSVLEEEPIEEVLNEEPVTEMSEEEPVAEKAKEEVQKKPAERKPVEKTELYFLRADKFCREYSIERQLFDKLIDNSFCKNYIYKGDYRYISIFYFLAELAERIRGMAIMKNTKSGVTDAMKELDRFVKVEEVTRELFHYDDTFINWRNTRKSNADILKINRMFTEDIPDTIENFVRKHKQG